VKNIIIVIGLSLSCHINFAQDWVQLEDYPGLGRNHPITFSIGTDGYVLAGQNENGTYVKDFYKYDTTTDSWTQLPNFPGYPRGYAYGIAHNGKAYVGFGTSNVFDIGPLDDLWEYDPVSETWTELASCPCGGRLHPAMLEAGGQIFVGLGNNNSGNLDDWWAYDLATDAWAQKADFIAEERHHPYFFSIDDIAYVGFGHGNDIYNDFYKYEPLTDTWTQVASLPAEGRVAGTQFSYNGKGYALSGDGDDHYYLETGEFWQYTPETDSWMSLPVHPGHSKWAPGCFVVGDVLYFTSGLQYDDGNSETLNDLWRFNLDEISSIEIVALETLVYPNPTTDKILLSSPVDYRLFSLKGELVLEGNGASIEVSQLSKGVYFLNTKSKTYKIIKE